MGDVDSCVGDCSLAMNAVVLVVSHTRGDVDGCFQPVCPLCGLVMFQDNNCMSTQVRLPDERCLNYEIVVCELCAAVV